MWLAFSVIHDALSNDIDFTGTMTLEVSMLSYPIWGSPELALYDVRAREKSAIQGINRPWPYDWSSAGGKNLQRYAAPKISQTGVVFSFMLLAKLSGTV